MPTLVIKNPDGSQQEQDVAEQLTIGRSEGNDLILSEGGVSRKHARFFLEGEALMVEDIGSANGTWVDGEKIAAPTKLSTRSQIVIGDYEIQLKLGTKSLPKAKNAGVKPSREPTAANGRALKAQPPRSTRVVAAIKDKPAGSALARRPGPQRASGPQLRGLTGGVTGKTFPLKGTLTVGRVAGVDLQIDDDSVSRRHAELVVQGREVTVKDLGSANGTTVNGAPISDETILAAGDIIQFGVVEMMFETGAASGSRAPIARGGRSAPERPVRAPMRGGPSDSLDGSTMDSDSQPMDPAMKKKLIIGGVGVGVFFLLLWGIALTADTEKVDTGPIPLSKKARMAGQVTAEKTIEEQIEGLLAECRTYSNSEHGTPDWARAEAACNKVIELEPIHQEANSLVKRISVLKVCEDNMNRAKEQVAGGQLEAALDSFAKVGKECEGYLLKTLSASKATVNEVKKRTATDCKAYASNAKWDLALKRCEQWVRLWCQTVETKELYPPALTRMKLDGPLNPKTDWRPSEPLYLNFLKAREKLKPGEPMWMCPEIVAFRPPPPPPDPGKLAKEELARRFPEPEMGRALVLYFDGRFADAPIPLQKIRENINKAQYHESANALLLDINNAMNLYENGTSEITNDRPDRAETPFLKALAVDERLVLGDKASSLSPEEKKRELERRTSFVRRNIVETMSRTCYEKGKGLADRKDFRAACRMWKLGSTFSRSNIDLLKALTNVCTRKASDAWERAATCEQWKAALDFAVDGDGFKEQINARMADEGCI